MSEQVRTFDLVELTSSSMIDHEIREVKDDTGDFVLWDDYDQLRRKAIELADAARWLRDLQNGSPLPKYDKDWNWTMERILPLIEHFEELDAKLSGCK